jgi:benzoyl-CoA reductase/2-hydroxyglutaryl-CoA dehydratase subunit BcrC/BadD/HgdB
MQQGTLYTRIDTCPMVRSNIAYIINNQKKFTALIGTTGCDMAHRMFDILSEYTDIPLFVLHMPRTDNKEIFDDEIDWLIDRLQDLTGKNIADNLEEEVEKWERVRKTYREFDKKRSADPSIVSTSNFHIAAQKYYQGNIENNLAMKENPSSQPRVFLVSSEISYESNDFIKILETQCRIVGDFTCGISQFIDVVIDKPDLKSIKQAYYDQTPCPYRRPNTAYYTNLTEQLTYRKCRGIIGFTLDYCDAYEFELRYLEEKTGLPVLRIRNDYSFQKKNQLVTRITAFAELLCSKK